MIRDMMLFAVERRFGGCQVPHRVKDLADNGSCYTAYKTINFAIALGLISRFTPTHSPESNGMAESFVKTFKRDYVRVNPRSVAITVLGYLDSWFEDYKTSNLHHALKTFSSRGFKNTDSSLAASPG